MSDTELHLPCDLRSRCLQRRCWAGSSKMRRCLIFTPASSPLSHFLSLLSFTLLSPFICASNYVFVSFQLELLFRMRQENNYTKRPADGDKVPIWCCLTKDFRYMTFTCSLTTVIEQNYSDWPVCESDTYENMRSRRGGPGTGDMDPCSSAAVMPSMTGGFKALCPTL